MDGQRSCVVEPGRAYHVYTKTMSQTFDGKLYVKNFVGINVEDPKVSLDITGTDASGASAEITFLLTIIGVNDDATGEVDISKVDIDAGAIDGTAIGANSASTGAFTTVTASTSLDITGSTGLILENDDHITNPSSGNVTVTSTLTELSGDLKVGDNLVSKMQVSMLVRDGVIESINQD